MKLLYNNHHQNRTQRMAFAGLFVILLPIFVPNLFEPLGRASPTMLSVRSCKHSSCRSFVRSQELFWLIKWMCMYAGVECAKTQALVSAEDRFA